jgi:hypothetical protein
MKPIKPFKNAEGHYEAKPVTGSNGEIWQAYYFFAGKLSMAVGDNEENACYNAWVKRETV